jgi:hypothetical protein
VAAARARACGPGLRRLKRCGWARSDDSRGAIWPACRTHPAFLDSYNQMVKSLRNYQAQSVEGGLGTGGTLKTN